MSLRFLALIRDQENLAAGWALEFGWVRVAAEVVTDAERVPAQFVDGGNFLADIRAFGAGDVNGPGLGRRVHRVRALVQALRGDYIFSAVELQRHNLLQKFLGHGFATQLRLDRQPGALNVFGVVGLWPGERGHDTGQRKDGEQGGDFHRGGVLMRLMIGL
jgi:hypothetical protein